MYSDGQVLGSAITTGVAVTALPLTSGNMVFQSLLIATIVVAMIVLIIRIVKLSTTSRNV